MPLTRSRAPKAPKVAAKDNTGSRAGKGAAPAVPGQGSGMKRGGGSHLEGVDKTLDKAPSLLEMRFSTMCA